MYKLYNVKRWGSMAPHLVLEELGLPYQNIWMTPQQVRSEEFRRMSPLGFIPALGLDDGRVIVESMAIIAFLTEAHKDRKLAPEPGTGDSAVYLSSLAFISSNIYGMINLAGSAADYSSDPAVQTQIMARAQSDYHRAFDILDARLAKEGPFLLGADFSAADLYLFTMTIWAKPSERALLERCQAIARLSEYIRGKAEAQGCARGSRHHEGDGIGMNLALAPCSVVPVVIRTIGQHPQRRRRQSGIERLGAAKFQKQVFVAEQILKHSRLKLAVERQPGNGSGLDAGESQEAIETRRLMGEKCQGF